QNSGNGPMVRRNGSRINDPLKIVFFLILLPLLFIMPSSGNAQLTEMGIELGAFNYTGDLHRGYNFKSHRPAVSVFLKSNLTPSLSIRYGISGGMLSGNDQYSNDPFNQVRNESFNIFLFEAFGLFEFNFLDYRSKHARIHWTPYLNFGLAAFTFWGNRDQDDDFLPVQPAIPMGVGIKYQLSKKIDLGFEVSARTTLFDHLDGVSDSRTTLKDYNYGNQYDFDTYFFIGITINYIFYYIPCPFDYN
ncbi:MAG: hypothetical protein KFF73_04655, partial [Cyclobacteriaceae bacterium]|nr:hypothetical protein [Cyclobacteriaceae bacterium]